MIISNRNIYNNFLKKYKGCFSLQQYNYFLKINKIEERLNFEEYFLPNIKHNDLKILFFIDFNKFIKNRNWYLVLNEKYMEIVDNPELLDAGKVMSTFPVLDDMLA
jgi:hypothetical protein